VYFLLNPIATGRRVFVPSRRGRVDDPVVQRIQIWRSVLGLATVGAVVAVYQVADSVEDAASDQFNNTWSGVLALCVTFPVAVGAFVWASGPGYRGIYARRALKPLGALLALFAAMFTFPMAMAPELQGLRDHLGPAKWPLVVIQLVWVAPFALYGIAMSLVHVFRTADVHDYLPPLLATVSVWVLVANSFRLSEYHELPAMVRIPVLLGGPVSVTLISLWEWRRLRTIHGVTLGRRRVRRG
jgi:hypothetical protein